MSAKRIRMPSSTPIPYGTTKTFYNNGLISDHYKNIGYGQYWHKTGHIAAETKMIRGSIYGHFWLWHINGTLKGITYYEKGTIDDIHEEWYDSGYPCAIIGYMKGMRQGIYKKYLQNGELEKEYMYEGGERI